MYKSLMFIALLIANQDEMKSLIDKLSSDDVKVRETSLQKIVENWNKWKNEDIKMLKDLSEKSSDINLKMLAANALRLIDTSKLIGETSLKKFKGVNLYVSNDSKASLLDIIKSIDALTESEVKEHKSLIELFFKSAHPEVKLSALRIVKDFQTGVDTLKILPLMNDEDQVVRERALFTLRAVDTDKLYLSELLKLLKSEDMQRKVEAINALAHTREPEHMDEIIKLIIEENSTVKQAVIRATVTLNSKKHAKDVFSQIDCKDVNVVNTVLSALGSLGAKQYAKEIFTKVSNEAVGLKAVEVLVKMGVTDFAEESKELLKSKSYLLRINGIFYLSHLKLEKYAEDIVEFLNDPEIKVQKSAIDGLSCMELKKYADKILPFLKNEDADIRDSAVTALGEMKAKQFAKEILLLIEDRDEHVADSAKDALEGMKTKDLVDDIAKYLKHDFSTVRKIAIELLEEFGAKEKADDMVPLLKDNDEEVRSAAQETLVSFKAKKCLSEIMKIFKDKEVPPEFRLLALETIKELGLTDEFKKEIELVMKDEKLKDFGMEILRDKEKMEWWYKATKKWHEFTADCPSKCKVCKDEINTLLETLKKVNLNQYKKTGDISTLVTVSLIGLSFLSEGSTLKVGKYKNEVKKCFDLVSDDFLNASKRSQYWNFAFGTLFLTEIYSKTPSDDLLKKLQNAYTIIARNQSKEGGWRHEFAGNLTAYTNVVVFTLSRLESCGIKVHEDVKKKILSFYENGMLSDGGLMYSGGHKKSMSKELFERHGLTSAARNGGALLGLFELKYTDSDVYKKILDYYDKYYKEFIMYYNSRKIHLLMNGLSSHKLGKERWDKFCNELLSLSDIPTTTGWDTYKFLQFDESVKAILLQVPLKNLSFLK